MTDKELWEFCSKLYNEILDRAGIDADKYEREDAFFGIYDDAKKRIDLKESCIKIFSLVHDYELSEIMYESCYANVVGFGKGVKL